MGCDGGTIPKRDELVRTKKKPEQVSKDVDLIIKWKHCALSQEPLQTPIVACELGCLFKKESVIEFLLDKSSQKTDSKFQYIRGLKDVKELQLTSNPEYSTAKETAIAGEDRNISQFICPITGLEMSGKFRFCYLLGCGCVFAERALNEIKDGVCLKCGKSYSAEDIIPLNGTEEEVERLKIQMEQRRLVAKEMKKTKKGKLNSATSTVTSKDGLQAATTSDEANGVDDTDSQPAKKAKLSSLDGATSAKSSVATSQASDKAKTMKPSSSSSSSKLTGQTNGVIQKKTKSIQDDPNASEAYKSLFSSHSSAKNQPKAHWVTHNPLYY